MTKQKKSLYTLAIINVGIWAIALIALAVVIQKGGSVKGMYVILAGGTGVAIQLIGAISKMK